MGKVARYIDGLTDEQRDRIIRAQEWGWGACAVNEKRRDPDNPMWFGCLVEQAWGNWDEASQTREFHSIGLGGFDSLVLRFGLDRIVRACKARAARANTVTLPEHVPDRSDPLPIAQ